MNGREATIENVSDELERLCLRQRELEGQQRELNRALKVNCILIGRLTHRVNQERERPPQSRHELIPESGIHEGDRVEVINPSKGQEKTEGFRNHEGRPDQYEHRQRSSDKKATEEP